jgi:hypothetical protein
MSVVLVKTVLVLLFLSHEEIRMRKRGWCNVQSRRNNRLRDNHSTSTSTFLNDSSLHLPTHVSASIDGQ